MLEGNVLKRSNLWLKDFLTKETSQLFRFIRIFHKILRKGREPFHRNSPEKKKMRIHANFLRYKQGFGIQTDITTKENKELAFFMSTDCEKFLKSTLTMCQKR